MAKTIKFRAKRACTIVLDKAKNRHMYLAANQVVLLPDNFQNKHLEKLDGLPKPLVPPVVANAPYVVNVPVPVETPVSPAKSPVAEPNIVAGLTSEAEKRSLAIQRGLDLLKKTNPAHWVKDGKVNTVTFAKLVGFEVTQEEVHAACPGFGRECARG